MLVLFLAIAGVIVAGAIWLGWSLLRQDRVLDEQRVRERLESTADVVATELRTEIQRLGQLLDRLASLPPAGLPDAAAAALGDLAPGVVIVRMSAGGFTTYPDRSTLFYPRLEAADDPPPGLFADAERLEFGGRPLEATARYRRLADSDERSVQAAALLRLARAYRQAGRTGDAVAAYDRLAGFGDVPVEGVPAGLVARWATCTILDREGRIEELGREARRLHDGLMSGTWTIDKPTFLLYREDAEAFLARAAAEADALPDAADRLEAAEAALAVAVGLEALWNEWSLGVGSGSQILVPSADGETVVMWRGTGDAAVGLVAVPAAQHAQFVEPLEPVLARQSAVLHLGAAPNGNPRTLQVRRTAAETGLPWELRLRTADPDGDEARLAGRRRLLLSVLALVVVLVAAGTWFSSRAVARELEVARMQSELVSAVSHDFRTPLTSLRQVTDALIGGRVATDRRDAYYQIQRRGIDRLHRLVEGLLDFRRMEAGAQEFARRPMAARPWVERVVRDFQLEVDKQGYTVDLSSDGADGVIVGDEPALTRALWNVLDNAVKYSPDCRTVWVSCRLDTGHHPALVVGVRDRGLGIDPAERHDIFDRFTRGTAAARSRSSGTGLGLAMVKHIIEAHGGEIEIPSGHDDGTTVEIRLPVRETT